MRSYDTYKSGTPQPRIAHAETPTKFDEPHSLGLPMPRIRESISQYSAALPSDHAPMHSSNSTWQNNKWFAGD